MSDDELNAAFGDEGYKRLPDEIIKRYYFVPSKIGIEEIHVGVYAGRISFSGVGHNKCKVCQCSSFLQNRKADAGRRYKHNES